MKRSRLFAFLILAAGMALPAAAQDWGWRYHDRDLNHDYRRVARMREDIARDRARLDEDIRCGRSGAAARDAADLARDQRALEYQYRDIRRDQRPDYYRGDWR